MPRTSQRKKELITEIETALRGRIWVLDDCSVGVLILVLAEVKASAK